MLSRVFMATSRKLGRAVLPGRPIVRSLKLHENASSPGSGVARWRQAFTAGHQHYSSVAEPVAVEEEDEVLVASQGGLAMAVLNRPKALNALNHEMIDTLIHMYEEWEKDDEVKLIAITADKKGFCAGGDVRLIYQLAKQGDSAAAREFFGAEYRLNYLIACLKKPHVAFLNGVVMGGGNGISIHGDFRVVTEKTVFAMPETAIALHPDVGASYFLSRLPGHFGEYLGLTGARLDGAEMLWLGLATHFVPSHRLEELEGRLATLLRGETPVIHNAIMEFAEIVAPDRDSVVRRRELVDQVFSQETVEGMLEQLDAKAAQLQDTQAQAWCTQTAATIRRMSPTSLKVTLRSIRSGRRLLLADALRQEYRLTSRAVEGATSADFFEGVRAVLIDKDNKPKWSPAKLEQVTEGMLEAHFAPLGRGQELALPEDREPHNRRLVTQARL